MAEPPAVHSVSAAELEVEAATAVGDSAAAWGTPPREAKLGKNTETADRVEAAAARGISNTSPGRMMAAATTVSTEETARAGSVMPTGEIATAAVAAATGAVTAGDMLPAMAVVLGAGAAVAAGIKQP